MRQEVTRQHKKDQWALDDVISHTVVEAIEPDRVKDLEDEGQHIHGLFMEGATWNRPEARLEESIPKKLFTPMPVIHVTGTTARTLKEKGAPDYGVGGGYYSAVYKYPKRNDRYLIFRLTLKTLEHPYHWKVRGVCLVAQTD